MEDAKTDTDLRLRPTAAFPLRGLTVLVVEDSRYSSEAMRLLCLRSGARIRRADCVQSSERHLSVYRPTVAIVDLGLPDGSGLDVIAHMHAMQPRVPIILGTSGAEREAAERDSLAAGANGFLAKPVASVAAFQASILAHMGDDLRPTGPRTADMTCVQPDLIAYREDLNHAIALLTQEVPPLPYLRRFLLGVARLAGDGPLESQVRGLSAPCAHTQRTELAQVLSRKIDALAEAV